MPRIGVAESNPATRVEHDLESSFVDHNLVMEPAEDNQVVLISRSASRPGNHMVDLETIPGRASVGLTHAVRSVDERPFQSRWSAVRRFMRP